MCARENGKFSNSFSRSGLAPLAGPLFPQVYGSNTPDLQYGFFVCGKVSLFGSTTRQVVRVAVGGIADASTTYSTGDSGVSPYNPRSATSYDGSSIYAADGKGAWVRRQTRTGYAVTLARAMTTAAPNRFSN